MKESHEQARTSRLPTSRFRSFRYWSVSAKLVTLIAPILILFVLAIVWFFPGRSRSQVVEQQATMTAQAVLAQIQSDRQYYASVVVPRLLNMKAQLKADYHHTPNAFPLPATFLREVTEMSAYVPSSYRVRLVSPWPINKRNSIQDTFEQQGFRALLETKSSLHSRRDTIDGTQVMRFLAPDRAVVQGCADCHNAHPDSPKRDFQLNDLMGGIEVNIPIEVPIREAERDQLLLLGAGSGSGLLAMMLIIWGTTRFVTRPVLELTNQMNHVALTKGRSSDVSEVSKWAARTMGEEVRVLWQQFWQMQQSLRETQQDLTDELQRQTEKHRTLNQQLLELQQATKLIQQASSEGEAFRILSHVLQQILPLRQIFILRLTASADHLELVRVSPKREELVPNSYPVWAQPLNCPVIRSGREFRVQDTVQDLTCSFSLSNEEQGAYWCVPMVLGGEVFGVVHLVSAVPQCWSQDIRQSIESLVNVATPMVVHLRHLEQAKQRALTDELTGAYNRRFLEESLAKLIVPNERRKDQIMSLLMLDLDHFKSVNDTYGHQVGDIILKTVASTLQQCLKETDVLARFGGEEFVVVLPNTDLQASLLVAERLRVTIAALSLRTLTASAPDHVTISAGVAVYPTHATTAPELIRSADQALYRAKSLGRNRVVCASNDTGVPATSATAKEGAE